jgi:DNA modification methylase
MSVEEADLDLVEEAERLARQRERAFNGLTAREWTALSRNVWSDLSSPRDARHLEHGAVFPVRLASRLITMYSRPGDLVLDPFLGVGSTVVAAHRLGRRGLGIELNPRFHRLATDWIAEETAGAEDATPVHQVVRGDCRDLAQYVAPDSVQVSVTSPPYADFIQRSVKDRERTHKTSRIVHDNNSRVKTYSNDRRDFGNLSYDECLVELGGLLRTLHSVTRPGGYSAWVVKDYRLPPERPYVPFHSDLARVAGEAGWLWHDLIVWDQNEQRRLVLLGYPTRFYTNQNCSFVVVLRRAE